MALGLTPTTLSFIAGNGSPAPSAGVTDVLQNGSSVVDNGVARVTVPVNTSDLQNDSGFITSSDIPAIPTKTSELQNDSGFVTSSAIPTKTSELQNDSGFVTANDIRQLPASTSADSGEVLTVDSQGNPGWAPVPSPVVSGVQDVTVDGVSVVTQGVAEITMPSVPTKTSELQNDSGFITASDIPAIPTKTSDLTNDSGFITSADLPTVNDGTLAIQKNGTTIDTFTANSSTNKTVNITVPTKTSDLANDSGFVTSGDLPTVNDGTLTIQKNGTTIDTFTANSSSNKTVDISVPTKTSDLTNDSGFITSSSLPTVNDATLTIQKNGSTVDTFTANASSNKTVNITVPTKTSDLTNDSGFITSSDIPAQVQSDWTEADSSDPAYIQNKPTTTPIVAGANISISDTQNGVVVAADLSSKEDEFDAGGGLEFTTDGQGNRVLQVEAPVDIVAGQGIAIDNPDGNTLRITNIGVPISATEATRCGTFKGDAMYTKTYEFTGTVGTTETTINMTIDEKKGTGGVNRIWVDPANSFVLYGSSGNNFLPLSWRLGSNRQGSVAVLGASTGSLSCRCIDTSSTPLTFNITIRYTVSA